MKLASLQEQAKLLTRNYQLLSVVLFCFCSNGEKRLQSKAIPYPSVSQHTQAPLQFITDSFHSSSHTLTPLSISF